MGQPETKAATGTVVPPGKQVCQRVPALAETGAGEWREVDNTGTDQNEAGYHRRESAVVVQKPGLLQGELQQRAQHAVTEPDQQRTRSKSGNREVHAPGFSRPKERRVGQDPVQRSRRHHRYGHGLPHDHRREERRQFEAEMRLRLQDGAVQMVGRLPKEPRPTGKHDDAAHRQEYAFMDARQRQVRTPRHATRSWRTNRATWRSAHESRHRHTRCRQSPEPVWGRGSG